jgi:hypothetical protein
LPVPSAAGQPFDYFHINSVDPDGDGNLIVSARNTWAAYKIDRRGRVLWILGGKRSTYRLDAGAAFAFQHDVHARNGDRTVTMFDDGAGPPTVHPASRGLVLALDASHQTAAATTVLSHTPAVSAQFEGNVQVLPDGDDFVGWGGQPYMTEYTRDGGLAYDARFVDRNASYRAYRFPWSGAPVTPPQLDVVRTAAMTTVYVSWNGATQVRSWRVLAGSAGALTPVATVAKSGFETQIDVATAPEVAVQALGAGNRVLATSATERVG